MKKWLPLIITLLFAGWYAGKVRVPKDKDWAVSEFGRIPVVVDGRHMPVDTLARTVLTLLRAKQEANYEPWKGWTDSPRMVSAAEWALEAMVNPELGDTRPVIRIDNPDVKGLFALPMEAGAASQTDGKHFSWAQLQPRWDEFIAEVRRASGKESGKRTAYENSLIRLAGGAEAYRKMKLMFGPAAGGDFEKGVADYKTRVAAWREAFKASMQGQEFDRMAYGWGEEQRTLVALIAPRKGAEKAGDTLWASPFEEVIAIERGEKSPTLESYAAMAKAYRGGDRAGFSAAVRGHLERLSADKGFAADSKKASREQLLSFAAPFYYGMTMAVAAALLAILYWFSPARLEWARLSAMRLMQLVLVIHTVGLIARFIIEGRPPVTTLYTSAIFIGWGAAIFGLLLEKAYPFSIGVVVAAAMEFCSLFIAHYLHIQDGTTFKVLQPVLDTNFWLATHVVIVTLGYAATFVAGFLAIIYVIRAGIARNLTADLARALTRMVYAIVCFAALFSFVGTVLGGLWADQSWGRFWGWDVKENGALMIVLWNALLLHARWGGVVRERGMMCLAIFGNVVTAWSWFGVNNLEIGLHSYGFTSGVMIALVVFGVSQVGLIITAWLACDKSVADGTKELPADPALAAS
jgi:ABC-type transport system involved in cytochrome c biogenesis permease subunit